MRTMSPRLAAIVPALLAALLAGCGGSSGSDTASPPAPPPQPAQPAPFTLVSTVPAATTSATTARDAGFTATFNGPVDPATVDLNSAQLIGPEGNVMPATVSVSGSSLKLTPQGGALPGATSYTAKLSTAIKGTSGQALASAVTTPFTTAAQQWDREIMRIGNSVSHKAKPLLAVAPDGTATAIWYEHPGYGEGATGSTPAWYSRLAPGSSTWSAPVQLALTGSMQDSFSTVAAPNGNIYLAYAEYTWGPTGISHAHVATFDAASGTWSTRQLSGAEMTFGPTLSIDQQGNLTALMMTQDYRTLSMRRLPAGSSTWSAAKTVPGVQTNAYRQGAHKNGNLEVAWVQPGAGGGLFTTRYDSASDAWSTPLLIDAAADSVELATDEQGGATMAWVTRVPGDAGLTEAVVARRAAGNTQWSAPHRLIDKPARIVFTPDVVVSPSGAATVNHWQAGEWFTVRSAPGTLTWERPAPKLALPSFGMTMSGMLVDRAGNVTMLLDTLHAVGPARYSVSSASWDLSAATRSIGAGPSGEPVDPMELVSAVLLNGDILAVWVGQVASRDQDRGWYLGASRYR